MSRYGLHTALCKAPRLHKRWGGGGGGGGACHTHVSKGHLGEHYFVSFICQPDIWGHQAPHHHRRIEVRVFLCGNEVKESTWISRTKVQYLQEKSRLTGLTRTKQSPKGSAPLVVPQHREIKRPPSADKVWFCSTWAVDVNDKNWSDFLLKFSLLFLPVVVVCETVFKRIICGVS